MSKEMDEIEQEARRAALNVVEQLGGPQAIRELARRAGAGAVDGVFDLIHQRIDWKYADPRAAHQYHAHMVVRIRRRKWFLGKWVRLAFHKNQRERWASMCFANGLVPMPEPPG